MINNFNDNVSETGFVFSLIGGLFWSIIGIAFFGWVVYDLFQVDFVYGNIEERGWFLWRIVLGFLFSVFGIWIWTAASWMRRKESLKKGAWTSFVLGILFVNILAIIGGILGLREMKGIEQE